MEQEEQNIQEIDSFVKKILFRIFFLNKNNDNKDSRI